MSAETTLEPGGPYVATRTSDGTPLRLELVETVEDDEETSEDEGGEDDEEEEMAA